MASETDTYEKACSGVLIVFSFERALDTESGNRVLRLSYVRCSRWVVCTTVPVVGPLVKCMCVIPGTRYYARNATMLHKSDSSGIAFHAMPPQAWLTSKAPTGICLFYARHCPPPSSPPGKKSRAPPNPLMEHLRKFRAPPTPLMGHLRNH